MKRWMAWLLAAVIALAAGPSALAAPKGGPGKGKFRAAREFSDVQGAEWALQYITRMQVKAIFKGYEDGTFRPNAPIRRIEAVVTAIRLMGLEEEAGGRTGVQLNFRDAQKLYRAYPWAVGYVAVALEKGLFDSTEQQLQPDREASRLWIATLLVRALGLQEEALSRMNEPLPFKDAKSIPAGAVGYIAVAAKKGIVAGYPDGTFKPNKPVSRAEMAALLDRTDQQLPAPGDVEEEEIRGTLLSVGAELEVETVSGAVYSVPVTAETRIFVNGKAATVDQLEPGLWVEMNLDADGNALLVVARTPEQKEEEIEVKGVITEIVPPGSGNGAQVTIETDSGEATYEIAETARIEIEGIEDATWEDLRVGDRVEAEGAGGVLTKIEVGDREEQEEIEVKGVITEIVPPGSDNGVQVTVETEDGEKTYEIAPTARIEIKGVRNATWEDLKVGDQIEAEGTGSVLTKIEVKERQEQEEEKIEVKGVVAEIVRPDGDGGAQITIDTEDGQATYEIAPTARIEMKGVRNATWEDLKVGDRIEAEGSDGVLTRIRAEKPKGGKGRSQDGED